MARRLEWQPVAAQGLNPLGALGTSISAFQGAAGTAQVLRNSERADDALIQNSYSDLIKSHLGAGQLELNQQTETRKSLEKGLEVPSLNPATAERIFTDHFAAGGTPENFLDNPNVMELVNQHGESAFKHGIQTFNRFNTGVEKEVSRLTGLAETSKAAERLEIDSLDVTPAVKNNLINELESKYANISAGIQASAFGNYTSSLQNRNRYLGLEPEEATTGSLDLLPAASQGAKSNEFDDYMDQLQSDYSAEAGRIDQERLDGLINDAEYSRQRAELDESYNQQLRDLGKDDRKYNITSSTGDRLSFDYTDLPDGGIQVGNRELPREVSNALKFAVDSFDVPMEVMLAFSVQESSLNPSATSPTGVKGLMQVTKDTGREMFEKNRELFESFGITADNINDRDNPLVSALTGAAYVAHIRDDILHGDAPIEQVYVAYNIGPDNPLVKQFHNKNVPIDKLPGINVKSSSIQNNIAMYYDKSRDAWRTPAQISALVRDRMKLTPAGEDPVTNISRVAGAESEETSNESVVDTELKEAKATNNYHQIDLNRDPIGELDRAMSVANSVIPMKTLGADGKMGIQLSATELGDMLTVMDITPDPKRIEQLQRIVRNHDALSTMPAEEVSVILSFSPKNMWGGDIDKAGTLANIETSLKLWEDNKEKIRAQMGFAANIKKYATAYTDTRERLQSSISELESSLSRLDNRELTGAGERAKQETARLLVASQRELASATAMYQGRIQEDYENILRFRDELKATINNEPSEKAQKVIDGLMKNGGKIGITREDMEQWDKAYNKDPLTRYFEGMTTP